MESTAIARIPEPLPAARALSKLHDLAAVVNRDGVVAWLSEGFSGLGDPVSVSIGSRLDACTERSHPGFLARVLGRGHVTDERVHLRTHSGGTTPARLASARIVDGEHCGATLVILHAEPDELIERELQRRIEPLATILDGAPDGVLVLDSARFVRWANATLGTITGHTPRELLDQPLAFLLRTPAAIERFTRALEACDPSVPEEIELHRRGGEPRVVSVSARPLTLPDGTGLGTVAFLRDVTEQRHIERELARRAEELQNWVHAVSHDLRSPLVAVLGFARLLGEDYGDRLDEQGLRFLRRIEEAGRTMESLVHDLLEFARIGRSEPRCVHVDPRDVLLQLQAELKPRLEQAGIELRLPEDPPLVWCDRTQLYQVLGNLVGNALDHAGPGRHPTVEVEVIAEDSCAHLEVRDWGRGVEIADRERIFEIFQTGGASGNGKRGTGIGLAIVRKIAESHGGAAWVESNPGEGATFHVTFPNA